MQNLNVPHYEQPDTHTCQAACAAMVLDWWAKRDGGGGTTRIQELFAEFSTGFSPSGGGKAPAITAIVAAVLAGQGLNVDYYTTDPDAAGTEGLQWLKGGPWNWTDNDVVAYASYAAERLANAKISGLTVHDAGMTDEQIEAAINAGKPVVMMIDDRELNGGETPVNHVVVITGINATTIFVHDPMRKSEPHKPYDRQKFLAAHRLKQTDSDAYVVSPVSNSVG